MPVTELARVVALPEQLPGQKITMPTITNKVCRANMQHVGQPFCRSFLGKPTYLLPKLVTSGMAVTLKSRADTTSPLSGRRKPKLIPPPWKALFPQMILIRRSLLQFRNSSD
jgi:hypothetical protein